MRAAFDGTALDDALKRLPITPVVDDRDLDLAVLLDRIVEDGQDGLLRCWPLQKFARLASLRDVKCKATT